MRRTGYSELFGVRISADTYDTLQDLRHSCPQRRGSVGVDLDVALSLITCTRPDFITSPDSLTDISSVLSYICNVTRRRAADTILQYYTANFPEKAPVIAQLCRNMPTEIAVRDAPVSDDRRKPDRGRQRTALESSPQTFGALLQTLSDRSLKRAEAYIRSEYAKQIDDSRSCYGRPLQVSVEIDQSALLALRNDLRKRFQHLQGPPVAHVQEERGSFYAPGNFLPYCPTSLPMVHPSLSTLLSAPADYLILPQLPEQKLTSRSTKISNGEVRHYLYSQYLLDYTRKNENDDPPDLALSLRPAWGQAVVFQNAPSDRPGGLLWQHPQYRLVTRKPVPEHHALVDLLGCYVPPEVLFDSLITDLCLLAQANQKHRQLRTNTEDMSASDQPDQNATAMSLDIHTVLERLQHIVYFPPFQICVDQRHFGNVSRFVRFVENPLEATCYVKAIGVSGSTRLQLHASRDLGANTELLLHAGSFSWIRATSELMQDQVALEGFTNFADFLTTTQPWKDILSLYSEHQGSETSFSMLITTLLLEFRLMKPEQQFTRTCALNSDFFQWLAQQLKSVSYHEEVTDMGKHVILLQDCLDATPTIVDNVRVNCNTLINLKTVFTQSTFSAQCATNLVAGDPTILMNGYYLYSYFDTHGLLADRRRIDHIPTLFDLTPLQTTRLLKLLCFVQYASIYHELDSQDSELLSTLQQPILFTLTGAKGPLVDILRLICPILTLSDAISDLMEHAGATVPFIRIGEDGNPDALGEFSPLQISAQELQQTGEYCVVSLTRLIQETIREGLERDTCPPPLCIKFFPAYYTAWAPYTPISRLQSATLDPLFARILATLLKAFQVHKLLPESPHPGLQADQRITALSLKLIHHNSYLNLLAYGIEISQAQYIRLLRELLLAPQQLDSSDSWLSPLDSFNLGRLDAPELRTLRFFYTDLSDAELADQLCAVAACRIESQTEENIFKDDSALFTDDVLDQLSKAIMELLDAMPPLSGKVRQESKRAPAKREMLWPGSASLARAGYNGDVGYTRGDPEFGLSPKVPLPLPGQRRSDPVTDMRPLDRRPPFSEPALKRVLLELATTLQLG
ncbi:hypothetical protein GMRT_10386 [Giardia muris]|uniref:Uncharacterized protein n=1 Tax=Giardia muris TaxID=5742 RepID=A0A4Z1TBZ3_GIAMU|nr:hypothetical protein GMRT_10386 [Giardia muris]|eukprot:TNJ30059.1 hypothetical protein GMRT_10386 [Giardia muris]